MVTLTQLEELLHFAECGTLSGAAEKCHISQPALSRSMQKLEDDFGVPLFNRGKNRTALNACGRLAAEGARRIISGVQGVLENVRALDRRLRTISVGSCAPAPLWDIVPLLAALYRDRTISTELREDHELISGLATENYRLAVLTEPVRGHGLVSRKYGEEHLMFSLPAGHPLAGRKSLRFSDLNGAAIPLRPGIGFWEEIPRKKMPDSHFFVQERSSSFEELVHAYAMPCFSSDLARRGRELEPDRVTIPTDDPEASVEYFLAWRRQDEDFLRPFLDAVLREAPRGR